jgi:Asp-tRNA(Asn)/Glu-tRNA(Gln) amidotransferase A subunit family amidase
LRGDAKLVLDEGAMISLLDILRRIESGDVSPQDAIRASHEAIGRGDDEIRAFVHVDVTARAGAEGPLRGIAVGVKDIIDTADMPTEMGSEIYAGWRPKADAPVVTALKRAGATPIGKTATTAFAHLDPTPTRNPRDAAHTPGGSSSGSAAAVAAGMVPLALGTQTGGSIIRPASFCGTAAIKPSYRLLPSVGVKCFSWALDTVGLFAATVPDLGYALAAIAGRADLRIEGEPAAPRIGVIAQDFAGEPEPDSAAALEHAARQAEKAGAKVRRMALPAIFAEAWRAHPPLQDYEAKQALAWEYAAHREQIAPKLRQHLDEAQKIDAAAYDAARGTAHRARGALDEVFADVDVLLTFSAPGPAPETLAATGNARFNRLWTLLGVPCVNVPGFENGTGLPVGVQAIAPFGHDREALGAAGFLERALAAA